MDSIENRKLSPLWKILMKNVRVDGQRHPLYAAEKIGTCLAKKKISPKDLKRIMVQHNQITEYPINLQNIRGKE